MGCKGRILWPPSCLWNNQGSSAILETLRTVKGSLSSTQVLASSFLAPFLPSWLWACVPSQNLMEVPQVWHLNPGGPCLSWN